jgi:hypothetical protein
MTYLRNSISQKAEYESPVDFTATYTSSSTITITGVPISVSDKSQIAYVIQTLTGNTAARFDAGVNGVAFGYSSGVITVYQYGAAITTLAASDVYTVGINAQKKGFDPITETSKTSEQSPLWSRYTDKETLISATPFEFSNTFADVGTEIDVRGFNWLTLWITIDIGTSTNPQLRILHKHTSAGSEEYREIYLGSPAANITTINLNDYEIASDADQLFKITLPVTGTAFVQIQAKDDANGDGQIDALYFTKTY